MVYYQSEYSAKTTVNRTLIIRADASIQSGSGHVMRCLALAQAWQKQMGTVVFVSDLPDALRFRLQTEDISVRTLTAVAGSLEDTKQVIALAEELNSRHIVVDGYHFGAEYQKRIKDAGLRLLVLDDSGHAEHYYADLVLNQNIHADRNLYPDHEPYTKLLLGTRYTLLRREFWQWRDWQRTFPDMARKVLITMGGSDPDNVTLKVLHALEEVQLDCLEIKVIVGSSNPHSEAIKVAAQQSSHSVQLEQSVTDMPVLMAWADVALSGAGSTCWELAFMGLPSVVTVLADNQFASAVRMGEQGVVINLGWYIKLTPEVLANTLMQLLENTDQRINMSLRGRELVDSRGGERVVKTLCQANLHLRPATLNDCRMVFDWANEPSIREASFSSDPILWKTHVEWFENHLNNEERLFWIAENELGEPIGQVRFTLENQEATISISLDRSHRGKGYGVALIEQASWLVLDRYGIGAVHAYIKTGNVASEKAFTRAGYSPAPSVQINDQIAIHLVLERR
jgi:UDP-2,4-diacetamido-2,4,6-trideoxy-beta-L-altropyranose hydrolase